MTDTFVDLVFRLRGRVLPLDHGLALCKAVLRLLPWIAELPGAGIHRVRGSANGSGELYLSHRAALTLRLPTSHVRNAEALGGSTMDVAGGRFALDHGLARALAPARTLYAHRVVNGSAGEMAFHDALVQELAALGVSCSPVVGKRQSVETSSGVESGYSVMLDGLEPDPSLRMQERGLGLHRLLGCGLFIRHKSAAPVAES